MERGKVTCLEEIGLKRRKELLSKNKWGVYGYGENKYYTKDLINDEYQILDFPLLGGAPNRRDKISNLHENA